MKSFKPRRNIERSTKFKVQYSCYLNDEVTVHEREFNSLESMRQWIARNDNPGILGIMVLKTLALVMDEWEPFTTIGKKTITLSDLQTIVKDLIEDYKPSKVEK